MKRLITTAACMLAVLAVVPPAHASNPAGGPEVIVGMIDTGVRPTHQEFDYRGPTSTVDQFVGWWDFTDEKVPIQTPPPGVTWDTRIPDPYDLHGHGTMTTSAAVGRNRVSPTFKEPSFAPGFKVAIAKVGKQDGTINGDIPSAVNWLVDTVHADVINMSIGATLPFPLRDAVHDAFDNARSKGVLVVVANGNGWADLGLVPGEPGWATPYGNSHSVLSVGASGVDGLFVTTDPEVTAKYTQSLASKTADGDYVTESGTSFASPLVAGMAAAAMAAADANGEPSDPATIETLLKHCAADEGLPPMFQGYGALDASTFGCVSANAAAGTLPARPGTDVNGTYVEMVRFSLDSAGTTL